MGPTQTRMERERASGCSAETPINSDDDAGWNSYINDVKKPSSQISIQMVEMLTSLHTFMW